MSHLENDQFCTFVDNFSNNSFRGFKFYIQISICVSDYCANFRVNSYIRTRNKIKISLFDIFICEMLKTHFCFDVIELGLIFEMCNAVFKKTGAGAKLASVFEKLYKMLVYLRMLVCRYGHIQCFYIQTMSYYT